MNIYEHSLRLAFDPLYSSWAGSLAVQIPYDQRKEILPPSPRKIEPIFQSNATGNQHHAGQQHSADKREKEPVTYRRKKGSTELETVFLPDQGSRINIRV